MTAAPKLATLAEVRWEKEILLRQIATCVLPDAYDTRLSICETALRLAKALKAITDAGGTADETVAARALLTQLGATP